MQWLRITTPNNFEKETSIMSSQSNDSQFSSFLEQRAQALFERIQYGCCVSDLMDFLAENESQWEKRAMWIMNQEFFRNESVCSYLDMSDEFLETDQWINDVVQEIDNRIEQDR
jgi:hypothetical protein